MVSLGEQQYWSLTARCVKLNETYSDWEVEDGVRLEETVCLPAHSCQTQDLQFPPSVRLALLIDHLGQDLTRKAANCESWCNEVSLVLLRCPAGGAR